MSRRSTIAGFTLVELLITMAIVAILSMLALPSYKQFVYRGNRADATSALLKIQLAQEKWRVNHTTYGTLVALGINSASEQGKFTIAISANTATGYVATATALGAQLNDTGCTTLTLTVSGTGETRTPATCW
ncbi:MAG: prepilin-type N-terminal cleavage/methylation domain-containing protein [Magnetococcus sp. DMHC-8]